MSLQFIMGNSGAGKSRYAYQKILAEAMRHPEKTYLIIVPEQFTMQTQKELVSLHPAGGILNVDILSFQRLAYRIFEETGGSLYPVLEETGKSLVVKRVAQEKKKELTILGSTLKRTGAVSQMKSLISELKQYQIAPSELDTWAEETGEKKLLAAKLKDTGVIYRAFEEYLENRYVTAEDVLEVLAGKLEESSLIRNSEVLVDGFTGFTPVQIGVLGKLFRLCEKVYVTIIMDEREDPYKKAIPHQLFAMSRQLVQQRRRVPPHGGVYLAKGVKGDLPRDEGREAHEVVQQKFVRRGVALPLGQQRRPVLFRQPVRVLLPRLGVRQMVEHPRQQGPGLGQVALHPAQAVHDALLPVQQEQVRPSAHHLQDQTAADLVAHLVRGLDDQLRQAFRRGWRNSRILPPERYFRSSIQNIGGSAGFSRTSSVS